LGIVTLNASNGVAGAVLTADFTDFGWLAM
jgi:hypothetical protein